MLMRGEGLHFNIIINQRPCVCMHEFMNYYILLYTGLLKSRSFHFPYSVFDGLNEYHAKEYLQKNTLRCVLEGPTDKKLQSKTKILQK